MTVNIKVKLNDRTPFEAIHNFTPDILELLEFEWYQWVWFHNTIDNISEQLA